MRRALFVVLLSGCGRIGFDPHADAGRGGGSGGSGNVDGSSSACPAVPQCPDRMSNAHQGSTAVSGMVQIDHGLSSSGCSSGVSNPELAVAFAVEETAIYTIDVSPTAFAVYVQDGCCGGTELRCGLLPFTLPRAAGQTFVVLVEGLPPNGFTVTIEGT